MLEKRPRDQGRESESLKAWHTSPNLSIATNLNESWISVAVLVKGLSSQHPFAGFSAQSLWNLSLFTTSMLVSGNTKGIVVRPHGRLR